MIAQKTPYLAYPCLNGLPRTSDLVLKCYALTPEEALADMKLPLQHGAGHEYAALLLWADRYGQRFVAVVWADGRIEHKDYRRYKAGQVF